MIQTNNNTIIPKDILGEIFSHLDVKEIVRCSKTCKAWKEVADSNIIWGKLLKRDFPDYCLVEGRSAKEIYPQQLFIKKVTAVSMHLLAYH